MVGLSTECEVNRNPRSPPLHQTKDTFPWDRLPRELRVKIFQNLIRCDLDKCRLLNRETFEIIRCNEKSMRRRVLDHLIIHAWYLYVKCDEEDVDKGSGCKEVHGTDLGTALNRATKLLKNADLCHLEMATLPLSDEIVSLLSSYLVDVGCRVKTLTARYASFESVTSLVLLQFLLRMAPTEIDFEEVRDFSLRNFSQEVLRFIVTRKRFSLTCMQGSAMPLDDSILAQLTATVFVIGAPNMITIDGLRSFIERVASGEQKVTCGAIFTDFLLHGVSFPTAPNVNLKVGSYVVYLTDRKEIERVDQLDWLEEN